MRFVSPAKLNFLKNYSSYIDVRAPIEFSAGSIPGAVNLPLLTDIEREQIGKTYKSKGKESAIQLGHELVSGLVRAQRVKEWTEFFKKNPDTLIYCARGGLRSQISQSWMIEAGCKIQRLEGGYKSYRQAVLELLNKDLALVSLGGLTGSGKSKLFGTTKSSYAKIDLEALANHRGSAFGKLGEQPPQGMFENLLAHEIYRVAETRCLVEDESRLIGKCCLPEKFYQNLRGTSMVFVEESTEVRCQNITQDYVEFPMRQGETPDEVFSKLKSSLLSVQKKLGGLEYQTIMTLMNESLEDINRTQSTESCQKWIQRLLKHYYDPKYLGSLERRGVKTLFRGRLKECQEYLEETL